MRLDVIDDLQSGLWADLGEPVDLLAGDTDVASWSGTVVEDPPDSVEAPGTDLSYEAAVVHLLFRRTDQPDSLPRRSRLRWRDGIWRVDETSRRADHVLAVTVYYEGPAGPEPVELDGEFSAEFSRAFDAVVS